ncbi:MAG: hypothetical protein AAGE89_11610 [Pseudomonadota bacterium]
MITGQQADLPNGSIATAPDKTLTTLDTVWGGMVRAQMALIAWLIIGLFSIFGFILSGGLTGYNQYTLLIALPSAPGVSIVSGFLGFRLYRAFLKHRDGIFEARERNIGKRGFQIACFCVPVIHAVALVAGVADTHTTLVFGGLFVAVTSLSFIVRGRIV